MRKIALRTTCLAVMACAVVPVAAVAAHGSAPVKSPGAVSHAVVWQNHAGTVVCGRLANAVKSRQAKPVDLLCSSRGIPRRWPAQAPGDPYVQMARLGRPRIVPISQYSYPLSTQGHIATLQAGAMWTGMGITCRTTGATVTCTNAAGHGFTIGHRKYRSY